MKNKGVVALLLCSMLIGCGTNSVSSNATSSLNNSNISSSENIEYDYSTYFNGEYPLNNNSQPYKGEIADPSVVKGDDGKFYVFSTLRKLFVSDDMCTWELLDESIIDRPTWADGEKHGYPDVWAPDCMKIKDKWIYYYSLAAWDMPREWGRADFQRAYKGRDLPDNRIYRRQKGLFSFSSLRNRRTRWSSQL